MADAAQQFLQFTDEQKSAAQQLDPSLEALLREVNLNEELIMAFRVQEIIDRVLFVALDTSEEGLRKTAEEAFGVDPAKGFVHKRELAKIVKAWHTAKVQNETKVRVDAVARAHGEPVQMLHLDWVSLMTKFKKQYGQHWHDDSLTSQSYFELFEERLAEGCLQAETLAHVVSVEEQAEQEAKKPEPARQLGLHLDGALTIQTKRRYMSSMPQTTEEFRLKYKVMSNCWLLAKMRQPGRHLYSDLTEHTFSRFCDELFGVPPPHRPPTRGDKLRESGLGGKPHQVC